MDFSAILAAMYSSTGSARTAPSVASVANKEKIPTTTDILDIHACLALDMFVPRFLAPSADAEWPEPNVCDSLFTPDQQLLSLQKVAAVLNGCGEGG
jgi:hypothetical protein